VVLAEAEPGTLVLRSRAPYDSGDPITVLVTIGTPPVPVEACQIMSLQVSFGAATDAGVLTVGEAGQGTLRLYDPLRIFDPAGPTIRIGTAVAVVMAGVPAFRGTIEHIDHDLTIATLTLVDRIASLAGVQFSETSVPAEAASARVTRILDLAGWPAGDRDISSGGVLLQAGTVAADAWSELVTVTRNELGAVYMRPDGKLAWRTRALAWQGGAPAATYGCPPSAAYISAMSTRADQSTLVNVLAAARRTGTQATVTDTESLALYGRHSHVQNDLELASDGDRDLWQSFYLTRQAAPVRGVGGFTMRPDAAALAQMLGYPMGIIVRVFDEHHGETIDRVARWVGARYTADATGIQVDAITGEDASIRAVTRSRIIDTGAEWLAIQVTPAPVNVTAREPGLQLTNVPRRPAGTP